MAFSNILELYTVDNLGPVWWNLDSPEETSHEELADVGVNVDGWEGVWLGGRFGSCGRLRGEVVVGVGLVVGEVGDIGRRNDGRDACGSGRNSRSERQTAKSRS